MNAHNLFEKAQKLHGSQWLRDKQPFQAYHAAAVLQVTLSRAHNLLAEMLREGYLELQRAESVKFKGTLINTYTIPADRFQMLTSKWGRTMTNEEVGVEGVNQWAR